jgi:predicted CopG family antitoxin
MAKTKTIAVTEDVWERLKQIMRREGTRSMNQTLARIIERGVIPTTRFGAHKNRKLKLTQKEHEEFTANWH